MSLNKEIERKWLVDKEKIPFNLTDYKPLRMKQSYISFSPTIRLRNTNDESYVLCVKTKAEKGNLGRDEFETKLSKEEYEGLLLKIDGNIVEKTRYCVPAGDGLTMEFDIFEGSLEGLAYMEIEFDSEESAKSFLTPEWAIADVSFDHRFKNTALAKYGIPDIAQNIQR